MSQIWGSSELSFRTLGTLFAFKIFGALSFIVWEVMTIRYVILTAFLTTMTMLLFQNCSQFETLEQGQVANSPSENEQQIPPGENPPNNEPSAPKADECLEPDDSWVFCNGFEEKTSAAQRGAWDDYDGNTDPSQNAWVKNPGPFNIADNQVHQMRVPAGRGGVDLVKDLPQGYDKLYARWFVQWEDGYNFSAPNHGSGLFAGDRGLMGVAGNIPNGRDWFSSWVEVNTESQRLTTYNYNPGMYQFDGQPPGSQYGDSIPCYAYEAICERDIHRPPALNNLPPQLVTNRWYCVEQMIDAGTPVNSAAQADGVLNLWIDGVEIGPFENMWFRRPGNMGEEPIKIHILGLGLFHHDDTHTSAGMLFDNVVMSTERIGCPK